MIIIIPSKTVIFPIHCDVAYAVNSNIAALGRSSMNNYIVLYFRHTQSVIRSRHWTPHTYNVVVFVYIIQSNSTEPRIPVILFCKKNSETPNNIVYHHWLYLVSFLGSNNVVTLKSGSEVTQGHW